MRQRRWDKWASYFLSASAALFAGVVLAEMRELTNWLIDSAAWLAVIAFALALYFGYRSFKQDRLLDMQKGVIPLALPAWERLALAKEALRFADMIQRFLDAESEEAEKVARFAQWNHENGDPWGTIKTTFRKMAGRYGLKDSAVSFLVNSTPQKAVHLELLRDATRHGAYRVCPRFQRSGLGLSREDSQYPRSSKDES